MSERPVSPRDRILETAMRLFYDEGIRAVGMNHLIGESGVANATFYRHYPSKDDLVLAYVREHDRRVRDAVATLDDTDPREAVRRLYEGIGAEVCTPGLRGCPFINAAVEYPDPDHPVSRAVREHMDWFYELLLDLMTRAGHPDPADAAEMLMILRHGGLNQGMLRDPALAREALARSVDLVLAAA